MRTEWLQRQRVSALSVGDEFVVPGFLAVSGEDKDGYSTLSPRFAGTRYRVEAVAATALTVLPVLREGLPVEGPRQRSAQFGDENTVLKVVRR